MFCVKFEQRIFSCSERFTLHWWKIQCKEVGCKNRFWSDFLTLPVYKLWKNPILYRDIKMRLKLLFENCTCSFCIKWLAPLLNVLLAVWQKAHCSQWSVFPQVSNDASEKNFLKTIRYRKYSENEREDVCLICACLIHKYQIYVPRERERNTCHHFYQQLLHSFNVEDRF